LKPWNDHLDFVIKHAYVAKSTNTPVASIPDDSGGLWQALKRSAEVENDLDVLSDPKQADDKY